MFYTFNTKYCALIPKATHFFATYGKDPPPTTPTSGTVQGIS